MINQIATAINSCYKLTANLEVSQYKDRFSIITSNMFIQGQNYATLNFRPNRALMWTGTESQLEDTNLTKNFGDPNFYSHFLTCIYLLKQVHTNEGDSTNILYREK